MCKERGVAFLVDTQAWRYWDQRTFVTEKFTAVPYAPPGPLPDCNRAEVRSFVAACLETQDQLGAKAFLLPGLVPKSASRDVHNQALELLETSQDLLPRGLPCFAFIGGHTSSMDLARNLVEDLLSWVTGVYGVYGVHAADAGLGEGESFDYGAKIRGHVVPREQATPARPSKGRLYVPQLGRSLSSEEWGRIMQVPALRGQLLCRLPCCAFGRQVDDTPARGREHSLHSRIADAKQLPNLACATIQNHRA